MYSGCSGPGARDVRGPWGGVRGTWVYSSLGKRGVRGAWAAQAHARGVGLGARDVRVEGCSRFDMPWGKACFTVMVVHDCHGQSALDRSFCTRLLSIFCLKEPGSECSRSILAMTNVHNQWWTAQSSLLTSVAS